MRDSVRYLDLISRGDTLAGLGQLFSVAEPDLDPLSALNRGLYSPFDSSGNDLLKEQEKRHLAWLGSAPASRKPVVLYNLGCFALYEDDILLAKLRFAEAVELLPEYVQARHNLGYTLELLTEFEASKKEYRKVLDQNPAFTLSRINLAQLFILEGDVERGLDELRELAESQPENHGATLYLCRSLLSRGDPEDGQEVRKILQARRDWQKYPDLKEIFGFALFLSDGHEEAEKIFREILAENPSQIFPRLGLLRILAARGETESLLAELRRYQELDPSPALAELIGRHTPS